MRNNSSDRTIPSTWIEQTAAAEREAIAHPPAPGRLAQAVDQTLADLYTQRGLAPAAPAQSTVGGMTIQRTAPVPQDLAEAGPVARQALATEIGDRRGREMDQQMARDMAELASAPPARTMNQMVDVLFGEQVQRRQRERERSNPSPLRAPTPDEARQDLAGAAHAVAAAEQELSAAQAAYDFAAEERSKADAALEGARRQLADDERQHQEAIVAEPIAFRAGETPAADPGELALEVDRARRRVDVFRQDVSTATAALDGARRRLEIARAALPHRQAELTCARAELVAVQALEALREILDPHLDEARDACAQAGITAPAGFRVVLSRLAAAFTGKAPTLDLAEEAREARRRERAEAARNLIVYPNKNGVR